MVSERIRSPEQQSPIDAIIILGAKLQWDASHKQWYLPKIEDGNFLEALDGWERAYAAHFLYRKHAGMPILLVTGGFDEDKQTGIRASRAEAIADVLISEFHIPQESVYVIHTDGNTIGNIKGIAQLLDSNETLRSKAHSFAILANASHLARAHYFFSDPTIFPHALPLRSLSIESVLVESGRISQEYLSQQLQSRHMKKRFETDMQGIHDYILGTYQIRNR